MPTTLYGLGPYRPGGSAYGTALNEALNVLPLVGGVYPLRALAARVGASSGYALSPTVTDSPVTGSYVQPFPTGGGTAAYLPDAQTFYAGTPQKLYTVTPGAAWTDVSQVGGYAVPVGASPGAWRFVSFGSDVWACNAFDIFQRRTAGAGLFANGPTSTFIPRPRFCGVVREFMIALDLSANGLSADQFTWSDSNDATWWDDRTGTRSASLAGGSVGKAIRSRPGQITGFTGGEYGKIYKRASIHALQLVGGGDIWRLDEVESSIGNVLPSSLIQARSADYFFGGDGFYRQQGLSPAEKISPPEIDILFLDPFQNGTLTSAYPVTPMIYEDTAMIGFESRRTGVLGWIIRNASDDPFITNVFFYNPANDGWSRAVMPFGVQHIGSRPVVAEGFLTGDVLNLLAYATLDTTPPTSTLMTFSASPMAATLKTQRSAVPGAEVGAARRIQAVAVASTSPKTLGNSSVKPSVVPLSVTVTAANDPLFEDQADADGTVISPRSETATTASQLNNWGELPVAFEGSFFEVQIDVAAGTEWTAIDGFYLRTGA